VETSKSAQEYSGRLGGSLTFVILIQFHKIQRPATPAASNNSSNSTPQSGSSTPILGRGKPRKSSGDLSAFNHSGSSTKHKRSQQHQIAEPKTPTKTTATASPFRKDFCRLGPVFEFRAPFFTVDSAFHTELSGQVPEESMRLYRQCVDAFWANEASTINGGFNRARMAADGIGTGNANTMNCSLKLCSEMIYRRL
jgi:hypothetical protein